MAETCGKRIETALRVRKMTAAELSRRTGISRGDISHYINGLYKPKQNRISIMAEALNVSPVWLMGFDVAMSESEITADEKKVLNSYRAADDRTKRAVDVLLENDEQ